MVGPDLNAKRDCGSGRVGHVVETPSTATATRCQRHCPPAPIVVKGESHTVTDVLQARDRHPNPEDRPLRRVFRTTAELQLAVAGDMRVLRAYGVEVEAGLGFAALSDVLRPLERHRRALPPGQADVLAQAMGLRAIAGSIAVPDPSTRRRAGRDDVRGPVRPRRTPVAELGPAR